MAYILPEYNKAIIIPELNILYFDPFLCYKIDVVSGNQSFKKTIFIVGLIV